MSKSHEQSRDRAVGDHDDRQTITPFRKPVKCPNCANRSARSTYPFCSAHCANVDLGRWFNESYAIDGQQNNPDG